MEPDMAIDEGCWTSINAPSWRDSETRSDKNLPGIMKISIPRSFFGDYQVCFQVDFEAFHLQRNILPCEHELFIREVPCSSFLPKTNREMGIMESPLTPGSPPAFLTKYNFEKMILTK